jgi:hypothetical protein
VVCLALRAPEDGVRPRHWEGALVRPLDFTVFWGTNMNWTTPVGALLFGLGLMASGFGSVFHSDLRIASAILCASGLLVLGFGSWRSRRKQ